MFTTTLYLVRHAEAQGNDEKKFQGHTDGDVSENGRCQLDRLAWRFRDAPVDKIYTSPLKRAMETAKAINRNFDLPLIVEDALVEINGGGFEGIAFDELPERYPEAFRRWRVQPHDFEAPGGESMRQVYDRMQRVVDRIVHANAGEVIVVVSHGCAIRNYLCYVTGKSFESLADIGWCDNTGVSRIEFNEDWKARARYLNDASHLPEAISTLAKQDWWRKTSEEENAVVREVLARG